MGVLAWLMLIITSLNAATLDAGAHTAVRGHGVAAPLDAHCHDASTQMHSCCDEDGHSCDSGMALHGCGCAAISASVLPSAPIDIPAALALTRICAKPIRSTAPTVDAAPPLRPPLA